MKTLVMSLAVVLLAMSSAPAGAADDVVVGRVAFVESCGGWVLVDFPFGRRQLAPAPRDVDRYVFYQGKELEELLRKEGIAGRPELTKELKETIETVLRERKLNQEIDRWTAELREKTRVLVYRRGDTGG